MSFEYLPSQVNSFYWIYCTNPPMNFTYPHNDGKWIMFFRKSELDQRWKEACDLYRSGKLTGVNSMKVSTMLYNPMGANSYENGMIIFYCGPSENEANIMEYGKNLLRHIYYEDPILYYKSDKMYLQDPNKIYKHLYYINTDEFYNRPNIRRKSINSDSSVSFNVRNNLPTGIYANNFYPPPAAYPVNYAAAPFSRASSRPMYYNYNPFMPYMTNYVY